MDTGNSHLTLEEVAPHTWLVLPHTAFLLMHCRAWGMGNPCRNNWTHPDGSRRCKHAGGATNLELVGAGLGAQSGGAQALLCTCVGR